MGSGIKTRGKSGHFEACISYWPLVHLGQHFLIFLGVIVQHRGHHSQEISHHHDQYGVLGNPRAPRFYSLRAILRGPRDVSTPEREAWVQGSFRNRSYDDLHQTLHVLPSDSLLELSLHFLRNFSLHRLVQRHNSDLGWFQSWGHAKKDVAWRSSCRVRSWKARWPMCNLSGLLFKDWWKKDIPTQVQ